MVAAFGCNRAKKTYPTISAQNPDGGSASIKGTYNHCPQTFFVASPDHVRVGQTITLTASASDADGDTLTYSWMASAGTIDNAHGATAILHCVSRGSILISLTVSDDSCDSTASGELLCQSEDAGAPDGAAGGTTGAGGQGGTGTGQPGTAGSTGATGGTTGAAGSIGPGTAGAIGSGGVTGSGGTGSGSTGTGGTACIETSPPAAIAADCAACIATNLNPTTDGCCMLNDSTGRQLCQAAAACMRAGGTCVVAGDPTACFCGTDMITCDQAGKANGPCIPQMTAAAGRNVKTMTTDAPTAAQVLSRQADPNYALGRAANVIFIGGAFCPTECGFPQ